MTTDRLTLIREAVKILRADHGYGGAGSMLADDIETEYLLPRANKPQMCPRCKESVLAWSLKDAAWLCPSKWHNAGACGYTVKPGEVLR